MKILRLRNGRELHSFTAGDCVDDLISARLVVRRRTGGRRGKSAAAAAGGDVNARVDIRCASRLRARGHRLIFVDSRVYKRTATGFLITVVSGAVAATYGRDFAG